MAATFKQQGKIIDVAAPRQVSSGAGVLVGSLFGVAQVDALNGAQVPIMTEGVHSLPKTNPQVWAEGDVLYWDNTNFRLDNTNVGKRVGVATDAALSAATTGLVKLDETVPPQAATTAALVDNSGGAAADGTIGAVTLPDLSAWNGATDPSAAQATAIRAAITALTDAITECATKINAMRTALRNAGLMA